MLIFIGKYAYNIIKQEHIPYFMHALETLLCETKLVQIII